MKFRDFILLFIFWATYVHPEILEINIKVDGMVCTACVSTIKKALLSKVSELSDITNIDLGTGIVQAKLKKGNNLTIAKLQARLKNAVEKASYKFQDIANIVATGSVKKDKRGYFLVVSISNQKINIPSRLFDQATLLLSRSAMLSGNIQKVENIFSIADDEQASLMGINSNLMLPAKA
jgi:copper chaperone CopZ